MRAKLVHREEGLEKFAWSSLRGDLQEPGKRPPWLETGLGLGVAGCEDRVRGRRKFLEHLEERVDWSAPSKAGREFSGGEGKPKLAVSSSLQRGWFFGSQEFKDALLRRLRGINPRRGAGGRMDAAVRRDHGESRGIERIRSELEVLGISEQELRTAAKSHWGKGVSAEMIQRETTMPLDWIGEKLVMGNRSSCCRIIRRTRQEMKRQKRWREIQKQINMSINHAWPLILQNENGWGFLDKIEMK